MKRTQSYTLEDKHIAVIKTVAKDNGWSASLALRFIIDRWVMLEQDHLPARAEGQGRGQGADAPPAEAGDKEMTG